MIERPLNARARRLQFAAALAVLALTVAAPAVALGARLGGAPVDYRFDWAWSVGGWDIGEGGLEVVDLNGDGHAEILTTTLNTFDGNQGFWYVLNYDGELTQIWAALPLEEGLRKLRTGAGPEGLEIVILGSDSIHSYSAASREELLVLPTASEENRTLEVGDLDGDGGFDAVVCDEWNLYRYDLLVGSLTATKFGFGCVDLALGQADDDPALEVALGGNASGGLLLDGNSLEVEWGDVSGWGRFVELGDVDGDGLAEVVSTSAGSHGIKTQNPRTAATLWQIPDVQVSALDLAEVNGSTAGLEVLWGEGQWGAVHVVAGPWGGELWAVANPELGVHAVGAGDADGDGTKEIVWSGRATTFVSVGTSTTHAAQSEDLVGPLAGYTAGDFRGTGAHELATAAAESDFGQSPGRLLVFDMATRRLVRHAELLDSYTATTHAVGAQLDGDVALEICVLEGSSKGCYDGLDLSEQWRSELARIPNSLAVAELDGTAFPEIVHGTYDGYVVAQEGESGWLKWQTPDFDPGLGTFDRIAVMPANDPNDTRIVAATGSAFEYDSQVTLVSAAGEIVAGPWNISVTSLEAVGPGPELWIGTPSGDVAPMNPVDGQVGAPVATFPAPVQAFARGDLDGDGKPEIVAAGDGRLWIHDGATGAIVWTSPFLGYSSHHAETLLLGDVDGDDGQEIVVSTRFGFAVFSGPQSELFRDDFETGDTWRWTFTAP